MNVNTLFLWQSGTQYYCGVLSESPVGMCLRAFLSNNEISLDLELVFQSIFFLVAVIVVIIH